jgi:hypothetical protein
LACDRARAGTRNPAVAQTVAVHVAPRADARFTIGQVGATDLAIFSADRGTLLHLITRQAAVAVTRRGAGVHVRAVERAVVTAHAAAIFQTRASLMAVVAAVEVTVVATGAITTVTRTAVVVVTTPKDEERNQTQAEEPGASREVHASANVAAPFRLVEWGAMSPHPPPRPPRKRAICRSFCGFTRGFEAQAANRW